MTAELSDKDRKALKYERRMGFIFMGLILCFGGVFNLIYFVLLKDTANYFLVGLVNSGIILLGLTVCYLTNKDINRDLKENRKELLKRMVEEKLEESSYEAGSGTLYIPVLGNLFPKLWGHQMRKSNRYFIFAGDYKHEVDKQMYDNMMKGSELIIHFAKHSGTVLSFSKDE